MRSPKFATHYKICGTQLDRLVDIKKHYEAQDRYIVSIACVDDAKQLYRVLQFKRDMSDTCGFQLISLKAGYVEVQP